MTLFVIKHDIFLFQYCVLLSFIIVSIGKETTNNIFAVDTKFNAPFNMLLAREGGGVATSILGALDGRPFLTDGNLTNLWNLGTGYIDFGRFLHPGI